MRNYMTTVFWGTTNHAEFCKGVQHAIHQLPPMGVFTGDNLFTFGRNLSFLEDKALMASFNKNAQSDIEKAIIWRSYVVSWAARQGLRLEGDFVEVGCYKGTTARIVCDYLDFGKVDKHYYLYDLFIHSPDMEHHAMPEHGNDLYERVKQRFADMQNVNVIQGMIPDALHQAAPEKVAFLHIDLNGPTAEVDALEFFFDRLVPGAILILDDYGWDGYYRSQKEAEDPFFERRGYRVLELPTGQGMVIK